jgi:hypothetical protein
MTRNSHKLRLIKELIGRRKPLSISPESVLERGFLLHRKQLEEVQCMTHKKWCLKMPLNLMIWPRLIQVLIFCDTPMLSLVIAFRDFPSTKGFLDSRGVGYNYFTEVNQLSVTMHVIYNTVKNPLSSAISSRSTASNLIVKNIPIYMNQPCLPRDLREFLAGLERPLLRYPDRIIV